jgi:hypothetical protein
MSSIDRVAFAGLIALTGACKAPDAVDPDAMMVDAQPADATPLPPVHITVLDPEGNGSIFVGTTLVFDDAQGHFMSSMIVSTNDAIDVSLPEGTSITAVFQPVPGQVHLETVFGVSPGDDLVLSDQGGNHSARRALTMTYPDVPGATYDFGVPCDVDVTGPGISLDHDCDDGPAFVVAHPPTGGDEFLEVDTMPPAPATNVDFTGPWRQLAPFTGTWSNIPADIFISAMHRDADHRHGWINSWPGMTTSGTTATASGMAAPTTAPEIVYTLLSLSNGWGQLILERTPGDQLTYQLDVGANVMPYVSASAFDLDTEVVGLSAEGGAVTPDLLKTTASYARGYTWTLFSPMTSSFQLPQLPDTLADLRPTYDDFLHFAVSEFEWSDMDDYAACLRHFDDTLGGRANRFSAALTHETFP